jgi:elongation factor Ts
MAYTAADVKNLRERTGAGMMDCKKALDEAGGDFEAAVDALRAKGLAAAAKKSSRTAAEGLVGVAVSGTKGVAVEVNSETDFVAKNDQFQDFVRKATEVALETGAADVEALKAAAYPDGGTVADKLTNNVATIGETSSSVASSTSVTNGWSCPTCTTPLLQPRQDRRARRARIGSAADVLEPWASRSRCTSRRFPLALNADDLDAELIARERKIAAEKAAESGKPAEVQAKMVDGAVAKYAKENALLSQLFVMDNKTPIAGRGSRWQGRRHQDRAG